MKSVVKKMCMALAVLLTVATTGCGASTTAQKATGTATKTEEPKPQLKEVKLKMYLLGDTYTDVPVVYEEVNKKLKNDINATVDISFMSNAEYATKYPLLFASGEEFDMIYSASWVNYADHARKGGFLEITDDLLTKYAPLTKKNTPDAVFKGAKIDGKVYMIPMSYREYSTFGYLVRGDLMKKYNIAEIKNLKDFGAYLDAVAKNETGITPYAAANGDAYSLYNMFQREQAWKSINYINYNLKDNSCKLFNLFDKAEFLQFAKDMYDWQQKGYWSKDAIVNKVTAKEAFTNGKSASVLLNLSTINSMFGSVSKSHPEWDIKYFDGQGSAPTIVNAYINNGMSINAKSKNPERSLMMLDLFRNNKEYFDLTTYGIKGTHYDLTNDGKVVTLPNAEKKYPADGPCPWGWRTQENYRVIAGGIPTYDSIYSKYQKQEIPNLLDGWSFNNTNVKNENAALTNVYKEYLVPILLGALEPGQGISVLKEKLLQAGYEKYMKEMQSQIDSFIANNK